MKRTDSSHVEVTVGDLREWIRRKFPDLPENCAIQTRTVEPETTIIGGLPYHDRVAVIVETRSETRSWS
jgi:hypothetical protein